MTVRTRAGVLLVGMVGLALLAGAQTPKPTAADADVKPLVFCAEPAALPRTGRAADGSPQGLDVAVAQLVGRRLGRPVEFHWCANAACSARCLREGRCEIIIGQPHDETARGVAWSVPYAGGQFGLVVPQDTQGVRSLADLQGKRVGVVMGSVALSDKNYTLVPFRTSEALLSSLRAQGLDAAFLDADFAAWYLHGHPQLKLKLVADYVPREHWNMAMSVRAESAQLLVDINRALAQLAESGALRKAYAAQGVAHRAPFTNTARRTPPLNTWRRIQERGELVVSMDPDNLPYSSSKSEHPGFDVELAQALARELGVKLRLAWLDVQRDTAIAKLLERECDLVFGAAMDPNAVDGDDELAERVSYSRPYYGTGYLLVQRKQGPKVSSLAELKGEKSRRIGAEAGSLADYRLRQRGYLRRLYRNQEVVLKALREGDIDHAYVWANVGWTLHRSGKEDLELAPGYLPEDRWDIAVALRRGDDELQRQVDAVLDRLIRDGTVARTLARYQMPYFPVFAPAGKESPAKEGAARGEPATSAVIRHPVAQRGLEPQMQRVQTSKKRYAGLERLHSSGTLVVGLDQSNLPFSTAHPVPAGLDYDIARLLAEQLGLSLRVYWAYSAHDSYPSKLASKNLCDVILGIMPDGRFAERVLYSKPYYIASYQLAVLAGDTSLRTLDDLGNEPLAVERAIAARALQGRELRPYANLEAILQAVATRQVRAGYVISTRGHWLAEQRWPGKIKLLTVPGSVDRFPIGAAVRRADTDLRAAIDQAWDELMQSGRLAQVFARWHIPYTAPNAREESSK